LEIVEQAVAISHAESIRQRGEWVAPILLYRMARPLPCRTRERAEAAHGGPDHARVERVEWGLDDLEGELLGADHGKHRNVHDELEVLPPGEIVVADEGRRFRRRSSAAVGYVVSTDVLSRLIAVFDQREGGEAHRVVPVGDERDFFRVVFDAREKTLVEILRFRREHTSPSRIAL